MPTEYFVDPRGNPWDGYTNYNIYSGQGVSAKASVSPYADSVQIYVDTNGTRESWAIYGLVSKVILTIGTYQKVLYDIWNSCYGGCNNPFCPENPNPFTYSLDENELSLAKQNGSVELTINACGVTTYDGVVGLRPIATLSQTLPAGLSGTVTVTVYLPNGHPAAGASVVLEDETSQQEVGSAQTNSQGQASFSNLTIGDSYKLTVSYGNLKSEEVSFDLEKTSYSFAITLQCPSGYAWSGSTCIASGITANITTVLKYVAVAGGVLLGGYAVVKLIPERKEVVEQVRK